MKRIFFLSWLLFFCLTAAAQNYPYRADYLWTTVPDHADWLYRTGENASVEIGFLKYGVPRDGVIDYEIADDMLEADRKGSVTMKRGKAVINIGTRKDPGFRDLRLTAVIDGVSYHHHVKLGFGAEDIRPVTKEPSDFTDFWKRTIEEAETFPLTYTKELAEEYCTDKIDCYLVRLYLNRQQQSIFGYLFFPKNAEKGKCPVVLCPPGAGIKTIKEPLRHKYYAENGCIRFETEIHGLDPRISAEVFDEMSKAFNGAENGYMTDGAEDRERYYMKRVFISLVKSIDLLTSLPEWDGKNVAVQGGSQGGALSIVAAGLDPRVTHCIANHPAMSDMAAYMVKGRTGGWPHMNRIKGFLNERTANTLAYYDVANFAGHVKAKVRMTWGYNDDVCPPTTSYAVWNSFKCPKESLITPINEHWTSEETEYSHMKWLMENLY